MRHGHAERLGGLESDGQLEFHRLLNRQLSRLFSFENSSGIDAGKAQHIVEIGSVTHQPTSRDEFTKSVTCGNCVARCQLDQLVAAGREECIRADHDGIDALSDEARERCIDIPLGAHVYDRKVKPECARRSLHVSSLGSEVGFAGLTRKPMTVVLGTSSRSNSNRFAARAVTRKVTPVTLPPGRLRLATRPRPIGSAPIANTIGMVAVAVFAATAADGATAMMTAAGSATSSAASAGK